MVKNSLDKNKISDILKDIDVKIKELKDELEKDISTYDETQRARDIIQKLRAIFDPENPLSQIICKLS